MSPIRPSLLLLAAGLALNLSPALRAADSSSSSEIKRVTDRYALTHARIHALLDQRQNPAPLPANPPNPFYQPAKPPAATTGVVTGRGTPVAVSPDAPGPDLAPEAADLSDIDTLRKYAALLKIGGVIIRNGIPHVAINNMPCKAGDIITVGSKDHPLYLKMMLVSSNEFTLGLNDATLALAIAK